MKARISLAGAVVAVVLAALGACNSGTGDCPAKESIQPGGSCSDDKLQCAYDLPSPALACDGTTTTFATSCTCTKGTWSCPSAVVCPSSDAATGDDGGGDAAGDDGGGDATGDDGGGDATGDDGGGDATGDDGGGTDAGTDAHAIGDAAKDG